MECKATFHNAREFAKGRGFAMKCRRRDDEETLAEIGRS